MANRPSEGLDMGMRRSARELALQILYQQEITHESLEANIRAMQASTTGQYSTAIWDYSLKLVKGTYAHQHEIDSIISQYSDNWELERICLIDRSILRLAIYEMLYSTELIPPKVCINEAVEVAKKYSSNLSPSFINGILDKVKENKQRIGS